MGKIPTYFVNFTSDDEQIEFVSLVHDPAIQVNWRAFSKTMEIHFTQVGDQQKLAGPLMVPDMPIYRVDPEIGEYNLIFTKEVIQKMADKFNKDSLNQNINLEHQLDSKIEGAYITENWIVDGESDKSRKYGFNLPDGSWFSIIKIENEKFWKDYIKDGKVLGFSIEGAMGITKQRKQTMNKEIKLAATEVPLADGTSIFVSDAVLTLGLDVYADAEGTTAAPDGEYATMDIVISVSGGKITGLETVTAEDTEVEPTMGTELAAEAVVETVLAEEEVEPIITEDTFKAEMTGKMDVLAERITALEAALMNEKAVNEELSAKVESFSKLPGAKSISLNKKVTTAIEGKSKQSFSDQIDLLRRMTGK